MCEYNTKAERRDNKRKNHYNKWIKHNYWENWGKPQWDEISKFAKKMIKEKTKILVPKNK